MNGWQVAAIALMFVAAGLAAGLLAATSRLKVQSREEMTPPEDNGRDEENRELLRRLENSHRLMDALRKENRSLETELTEEQDYTSRLEEALDRAEAHMRAQDGTIGELKRRSVENEQSAAQSHMRAVLLQREIDELRAAKDAQEKLYQDMIRERDEELAVLREGVKKNRRRRVSVPEAQVTLDDILAMDPAE